MPITDCPSMRIEHGFPMPTDDSSAKSYKFTITDIVTVIITIALFKQPCAKSYLIFIPLFLLDPPPPLPHFLRTFPPHLTQLCQSVKAIQVTKTTNRPALNQH